MAPKRQKLTASSALTEDEKALKALEKQMKKAAKELKELSRKNSNMPEIVKFVKQLLTKKQLKMHY